VLIAIDQDCDDNLLTNPNGHCDVSPQTPTYRDTAPLGYALAGAGVVAIGAGVFLYLHSKPATTTATAWIDPGRGAGVGVAGRF
jgi:hypothetical protein